MNAIRLLAVVNEKHELIVTLPADVPVGPVELLLQPVDETVIEEPASEREHIRAKLMAAGLLVKPEDLGISPSVQPLSLEERLKIGQMPVGARPVEDLVDEDRGDR
ncbi:MAG: hypothetical protein LCI00_30185 [Chloroflexi bacterium]|nr:hypothetical protein [Chloroflexota bacterium]MCC6892836.1 hypothetical protein [Anaerolineae bacterium]